MHIRILAVALAAIALSSTAARAQDSVVVIDPDAPVADSTEREGPPPSAIAELLALYNDSATTRLAGDVTLPAGTTLNGAVGLFQGTLRVAGRIDGPVVVVNGNLRVLAGGEITGRVLVVGGRATFDSTARIGGPVRRYYDAAPVARTVEGLLVEQEPPKTLGQLASARLRFGKDPLTFTLLLATDGTYDRIEGLPIQFGGTLDWRMSHRSAFKLDLRGIIRTSGDQDGVFNNFGYRVDAEWRHKGTWGTAIGVRAYSVVDSIEGQPLSRVETGWSSVLFQLDYHDYFERQGIAGYVGGSPARWLRLELGARYNDERSLRANDPWSLFPNSNDQWRPNPLIDDGSYLGLGITATVDTRNNRDRPTSGWWVRTGFEHTSSNNVAPLDLPTTIRDPIPTDRTYGFDWGWLDLRRYNRIGATTRLNLRLLTAGWLGGDPLPMQHRHSLGGPDIFPGLPFRALNCSPPGFDNPSQAALCDRMIATQAELRFGIALPWKYHVKDSKQRELDRIIGIRDLDFVILADAGDAWLTGDGPGRVPSNRVPVLSEWQADIGIGLELGGFGVYMAKAITNGDPVGFSVRLQRRF